MARESQGFAAFSIAGALVSAADGGTVMFGYSKKVFSLSADLKLEDRTDELGWTKFSAKAGIEGGGGKPLKVELELEGQFVFDKKSRTFEFSLKVGTNINGKTSLTFAGEVTVKMDDKTITASIEYSGKKFKVALAYKSEHVDAVIEILRNGKDVGVKFYVEYTIGRDKKQKASEPIAA